MPPPLWGRVDSILMRSFDVYLVRPTDPNRRAKWLDVIGRETLPVRDGRARSGTGGRLVYDVDTGQLTKIEAARLASFLAGQTGQGFHMAFAQVMEGGASLPAVGCELLIEEDTAV